MKITKNPSQTLRIIWAIVAKDILEALKNKNTIAIILTTLPMILVYYYLPILGAKGEPPFLRVFDAGDSILVALLENSDTIDVRTYPSEAKMFASLRNSDVPQMGLVIPAGFDDSLERTDDALLQGYVMSWVATAEAAELQEAFESEIAMLVGRPVPIQTEGNQVDLEPNSHGISTTAALATVFVVVMIGLTMIPHLMLEEKKTRTMDVLLVSPASVGNLVVGKALVGLFYCLLGATVALAVFNWLVIHWWLAIISVVIGSLFTISLGLWLGNIIESRAQLTMWAWVFILPLLLPVILSLMEGLVPNIVIQVIQFVPTAVLLNLLRTSFSATIPLGNTLLMLTYLAAWSVAGLLFVAWLVRRQGRAVSSTAASQMIPEERLKPAVVIGTRWLAPLSKWLSLQRKSQLYRREMIQVADAKHPEVLTEMSKKRSGLRIIWAIAAKDILATLKNKLALSILMGTVIIVASNTIPLLLLKGRDNPALVVYDPGRSTIMRALAASEDIRLGITDSLEEMQERVSESPELQLGLVIPEDFDSKAGDIEVIELDAYVVHWAESEQVDQRVSYFQDQIGQATWGTVQINVSEQRLYPPAELRGQTIMFVLLMTIVILTIGIALVPLLLVEERMAHTLEVLLVSPARIYEVVGGKALAGGFYCLLAVIVVFTLNRYLVVNWGVALLAVLLGGIFAVALGLLVGIVSDNPTTVGMWGAMLLLSLFGITMLTALTNINWPPIIQTLMDYLPTVALAELIGYSLAGEFPPVQMWANSAALLISALIVFGLLAWRVRLADR